MLFPAKISEDSPWKQETATSRLDPDTENRTQEAIDNYFSFHHKVTSPEDLPRTNTVHCDRGSVQSSVSHITTEDLGGSPELRGKNEQECNDERVVPTPKGVLEFRDFYMVQYFDTDNVYLSSTYIPRYRPMHPPLKRKFYFFYPANNSETHHQIICYFNILISKLIGY